MNSYPTTMSRPRAAASARAIQSTHVHLHCSTPTRKTLSGNEYPRMSGRPVKARLTTRGRVLALGFTLMLAMLALGVFGALRAEAAAENTSPAPAGWQLEVVQPQETLWHIARQAAPGADPRPLIDQIKSVNELSGSSLQAGARLWLPPTQP
jgi:hypothetical protein